MNLWQGLVAVAYSWHRQKAIHFSVDISPKMSPSSNFSSKP